MLVLLTEVLVMVGQEIMELIRLLNYQKLVKNMFLLKVMVIIVLKIF